MNAVYFIPALLLGIGGSIHCIGMCGPLAMAIPFPAVRQYKKPVVVMLYYVAKALSYGFMGLAAGFLGKGFQLMDWQQLLSVLAGVFILAMALLPRIPLRSGTFLFQKEFARVFQKLQAQPKMRYYFILGLLNGLLPCGLVYTALAAATITGHPLSGFIFMFLFGLGTSPALVAIVLFKNSMGQRFRKYFRHFSFTMTLVIGVVLVLRGMDLGIPYLSPGTDAKGTVEKCCSK